MRLTQIDLAAALGVNQSTISRLETGEMPVDQRTKLALQALMMRNGVHLPPDAQDTDEAAAPSPGKANEISPCTQCDRAPGEFGECALLHCAHRQEAAA